MRARAVVEDSHQRGRSMMAALALVLAYTGFGGLCFAMQKHHRQLWGRDAAPALRVGLRITGWICLVSSFWACVVAWGEAVGAVAWFGVLSVAGIVLACLLPYAARTAAMIALASPVLMAMAIVLG